MLKTMNIKNADKLRSNALADIARAYNLQLRSLAVLVHKEKLANKSLPKIPLPTSVEFI